MTKSDVQILFTRSSNVIPESYVKQVMNPLLTHNSFQNKILLVYFSETIFLAFYDNSFYTILILAAILDEVRII